MRLITFFMVTMLTLSCSMLTDFAGKAITGAMTGDKKGISLDAQVGDRENEVTLGEKVGVGDIQAKDGGSVNVKNVKSDTKFESAGEVVIQYENIPPWLIILLLITWALPTPTSCWRAIKQKFKRSK